MHKLLVSTFCDLFQASGMHFEKHDAGENQEWVYKLRKLLSKLAEWIGL